jgi:hypothetical protein
LTSSVGTSGFSDCSNAIRTNRQRKLCFLPVQEGFKACQHAAGEPASRIVSVEAGALPNPALT